MDEGPGWDEPGALVSRAAAGCGVKGESSNTAQTAVLRSINPRLINLKRVALWIKVLFPPVQPLRRE
jgi:hypothetical protein